MVDLLPSVIGRAIGFYIAPVLGFSFLILISTLYGWILPYNWKYSIPLTLSLVILSVLFEKRKKILVKDGIYTCLFTTICSLPVLISILRYQGYNPFTDIFTYLVQAQWLQENLFAETITTSGNYPALTQVSLYQATGSRMGGSFFLGFVQSLFNLKWSYYAYTASVSLGLVTGCMALGGVVRQVIPAKKLVILAISLLPAIMTNGFIYGAQWGFYPQTLGLTFALGICAIFPCLTKHVLNNKTKFWKLFTSLLPLSVCLSALLYAYNEPFPIFAIGLLLYVFIIGCLNINKIKNIFLYLISLFSQVLILMNFEAIRIFQNLYQTLTISSGNAEIGWPVLWSPIQFLAFSLGMKSPFNAKILYLDAFLSTFCAFIVVLLMVVTLAKFLIKHPKRKENIIFLVCINFVLLLVFLKFRYLSIDKSSLEIGHTFLQFKIAKYATPFSMSLLGIFTAIWWIHFKKHQKTFIYMYLSLLIVGLVVHCMLFTKHYTNHFLHSVNVERSPFDVLLKLRETVADTPKDKVIYVDLGYENAKLRQMVAYILYDRKIAGDYRDDGYILGRLPADDANMSKDGSDKIITMKKPTDSHDKDDIFVGPFVIKKFAREKDSK
ncbi:MAG: hypothetical protein P1U74_00515 [Legionellaceae bacterium]|nr:hypothetical protein [Legionellaceae bacterium]